MQRKEFSQIRHHLGKTQKQLAQLLGVSIKTIQSFEQGWRNIPVHTERQALLLLALKSSRMNNHRPCWEVRKCSMKIRKDCPAWEFNAGHMCWLINGTICQGEVQRTWSRKMQICRKCTIFKSVLTSHIPASA